MTTVYSEQDMDDIADGRCLVCGEVETHSPACIHAGDLGHARGDECCTGCGHHLSEGEAYWAAPDLLCLQCAVVGDL